MSGSTNFLRDTRRDILRAVREQSMDRTRAMDEYVEALVGVESLTAQVERAAAKADELRRAARDAGNSAAEINMLVSIRHRISLFPQSAYPSPTRQRPLPSASLLFQLHRP